jgi:hypothetical protein
MTVVTLPIDAGKNASFRLHLDGGGLSTPGDPGILNFWASALGWKDAEHR